jgi:TetR/AcrR family transcriptional regulator, cholesterol catabolism regulator
LHGTREARDVSEPDQDGKRSKRGRPRQGKPIARHLPRDEEILRIAAQVFFNQGYGGTKLEDIAREAGIVKGSLYHYFESKEEIYERLIADIVNLVDVDETVHSRAPADERLAAIVRRRVEMVADHPVEIGILGRQLVHMEGEIGDWARTYRRSNFEGIREIIVQGQKTGVFRPADPDALAAFVLGSLTVLSEWYRPGGRLDREAIVLEMVGYVLSGVGVPAGEVPAPADSSPTRTRGRQRAKR